MKKRHPEQREGSRLFYKKHLPTWILHCVQDDVFLFITTLGFAMQVIEFEAVKKAKKQQSKKIRKRARAMAQHFKATKIKTKGFVFDREEANAQ